MQKKEQGKNQGKAFQDHKVYFYPWFILSSSMSSDPSQKKTLKC